MIDIKTPSSLAATASPDRRSFLCGLAGLSLVGPATAAFPAMVAVRPHPDATVFDLVRDLDAATLDVIAAADATLQALERVVHPEPPAALFWQPGDDDMGVLQPTYFRDGLAWYGNEVDLVKRAKPRRARTGPDGRFHGFEPDPEGVARVAEIVAADCAWQAEKASAYAAAGVPEANAASAAAGREVRRLMVELTAAPAFTLAGVLVKARVVGEAFGGTEALAEEIGPEPDGTAETMALAVMRDLLLIAEPPSLAA